MKTKEVVKVKIPKTIIRNGLEYKFIKKYPNFYLYQHKGISIFNECFKLHDLRKGA